MQVMQKDGQGSSRVVRFGVFEANLFTRELRKRGVRVRLQEQPFRLLQALLERPGQIVTREEIKEKLWPDDTFVDFDNSLNTAAQKLRLALGDSAESPRFIETIPRQGYRFLAPIGGPLDAAAFDAGGPVAAMAGQSVSAADALPPDAVVVQRGQQRAERAVAAVLAVALLGLLAFNFTQAPPAAPETPTRRFSFTQEGVSAASISPDGRYVAFAAGTGTESSLWLRALESETAREIPGTEGARPVVSGWSPDSQAIVFATTTEIKRVGIGGGDPITLGDLPGDGNRAFLGVSWSPDGKRIVFSSLGGRLYEIPARGGDTRVLVDRDLGDAEQPHFLPTNGGPAALVYQVNDRGGFQIWVSNLETGERSEVAPGSAPVYSRDGYLIHEPGERGEGGLLALPFSLASLESTGEAASIAEDGRSASVARDGTLAYLDAAGDAAGRTLIWRNRAGELIETIGQPQPGMEDPALSPDGQRIAVSSSESGYRDIWVHDLIRSTMTRVTFDEGAEASPTWSPSGEDITYFNLGLRSSIRSKATDGTGEPVTLVESERVVYNSDWSRDGRYLVYNEFSNVNRGGDIRYREFGPGGEAGEPVTFLSTPAEEQNPKLSPNGRFVAYVSNESGRPEIYVRPFPDGAGRWQASVNGGGQVRWGSDGKELYYVEGEAALMAVSVSTEGAFTLGQPQQLFESSDLRAGGTPSYDVSADGQRFVMAAMIESEEPAPPAIHIVLNWYEEFRDRAQ